MAGPPGANPMSTANPDAELVARGEQFEKFLLEYMDAWLEWAPLMRAARAQVGDDISVLITAIERTGCDAAQARMSELERAAARRGDHRRAGNIAQRAAR